jgi:hypothetical protein
MKSSFVVTLIILFGLQGAVAQNTALVPKISKPVYFDVSPPLRDMVQVAPGPVDMTWKDGVVMNYFLQETETTPSWIPDPSVQSFFGPLTGDTIVQNFDGLPNVAGFVPPDTYGEAGLNHYFQVVNASYAIYNKSGEKIFGPAPNSSVWNGFPNNDNSGDAVVCFDENANRWLFTQFSLPNYPSGPFFQMIAVSQTPDPMGPWYRYQYEFADMPDYPKFGIWPDGYYMSANRFAIGAGFAGDGAYAFDRTAMLAGDPDAVMVGFEFYSSNGFITLYPSDCDGPFPPYGTPNYFGYIKANNNQHFGIYEFHADFTNPGNSTFGNLLSLNVTPFNTMQSGIPQLGSNKNLEVIGDRLMYRLQFRKFNGYDAMVINHTVNAGGGKAGVRWYELRKTTGAWSIYQQATYAPDNHSRWMGSIAMDTAGSIALGYSVSSASMYPAIRYTGRLKTDPLNTMTLAESSIIEGGGSQTGSWSGRSRWGDYSGMSIDPANPTTFWYTTEYYQNTSASSWVTRIAAFTFDDVFSTAASASPAILCAGDSSQLEAIAYGGSNVFTYSWTSIPPGFTSTLKDPWVIPSDTTTYIVATSDGTQTRHDTASVKVVFFPTVFAGNDTTVCQWITSLDLYGTASNYRNVGWASPGDGTFSNRYELNTTWFPGPKDKAAGYADIYLFAFAASPCSGKVNSMMKVTLDPCTAIPEAKQDKPALTIMPNPAEGLVTISLEGIPGKDGMISLTGPDGKELLNVPVKPVNNRISEQIDLSRFSRGVYMVRFISGETVVTGRLILL